MEHETNLLLGMTDEIVALPSSDMVLQTPSSTPVHPSQRVDLQQQVDEFLLKIHTMVLASAQKSSVVPKVGMMSSPFTSVPPTSPVATSSPVVVIAAVPKPTSPVVSLTPVVVITAVPKPTFQVVSTLPVPLLW